MNPSLGHSQLVRMTSIDKYFLHIVNLILRAEILYIPHRWWHILRVDDTMPLLCGFACILILIIRLSVAVIVTWK